MVINLTTLPLTDQLAVERTRLANERTLLAYVRTGLALVAGGFGVAEFVAGPAAPSVGVAIAIAGFVMLGVGIWRFMRARNDLRATVERVAIGTPQS
jgi:putative membrane protein